MYDYDLLIIGGGLAGLRAAIEAARSPLKLRVALISKVHPLRSQSVAATGGINAALGPDDSWESHAFDTIVASDWLADQDAVEIMCREAADDIRALERMGVMFNRDEEGRLGAKSLAGSNKSRTIFVGEITGKAILNVLFEQCLKLDVAIYSDWYVTSLVVEDGTCSGLVAIDIRTGRIHSFKARAVVLATGGLGRLYTPTTNFLISTGDGLSLAYRAGAHLMDMEMTQFYPTTLKSNGSCVTEAARTLGALLLNSSGERFMQRYDAANMEMAGRDLISRAIQMEIDKGNGVDGCVLLDCRPLQEKLTRQLGVLVELAEIYAGVDVTKEPLPIVPAFHYQMGGIKTDVEGATSLSGLYAAGECACISVHGANRLGANSLLETIVFGRRAGQSAAMHAKSISPKNVSDSHIQATTSHIQNIAFRKSNDVTAPDMRKRISKVMNRYVGLFRDSNGL